MARRATDLGETDLSKLVASLSLNKDDTLIFHKSIGIMCWVSKPQANHTSNAISVEELRMLLRDHLHMITDSNCAGLPRLKAEPLAHPLHLNPCSSISPPDLKPNLLMIALKLLDAKRNELHTAPSSSKLIDATFEDIDFIVPRKVMKSIILEKVSSESWEILVSRPITSTGTLFIDRTVVYETNHGSIGHLFEAAMTERGSYHRVYVVSRVTLGGMSLINSGEIDAFDDENRPVEITSRPAWAKFDASRQFQNHTQCMLAGVKRVITGGFRAERGVRNGTVSFFNGDLQNQTLETYGLNIPKQMMTDAYNHASTVLKEIQKLCKDVGKVYRVRSTVCKSTGKLIEVEELTGTEAAGFPITADLLVRCVEACSVIADKEETGERSSRVEPYE